MARKPDKLTLGMVLGAFFSLCADDNHTVPSNKNHLMMFLLEQWGRRGETVPDFLKGLLEKVTFDSVAVTPWSDIIAQTLTTLSLAGEIAQVEGIRCYWVEYGFEEMYEGRFEPDQIDYLRQLAIDYREYLKR